MLFNIRSLGLLLAVVMLLTMVTAVQAGKNSNATPMGKYSRVSQRANAYGAFEHFTGSSFGQTSDRRIPMTSSYEASSFASPGVPFGNTYYEYQHNCSMGRMVETGPHTGVTGPTMVHFSWMYMPDSIYTSRSYAYNAYDAGGGGWAGAYILHDPDEEYSGYVNVDVTPDNRGIVGGHSDQHGPVPYMGQFHFDACSGCENFAAFVRVPDELGEYASDCDAEFTWPKFFLQFGSSGVDTVLHIVAMSDCARTDLLTVGYFRYLGYEGLGSWDPTPYVVDTVETISADITGERVGDRVCLSWFANLAYGGCDTCSGPAPAAYSGTGWAQRDNDMYVQISNDQGETWEPRINVTQHPIGTGGYKAYCASSVLFDQTGNLHVVWAAGWWPADPELDGVFEEFWSGNEGRLLHWSENVPYVRTIMDFTYYGGDNCGVPIWSLQVDKPAISECDGKLYALYTQFNDIPNGVDDDCATWGYPSTYWGAANSDIWVSVSGDGGMTWDIPRNLTNTYTPNCDPSHGGIDCQADHWASMSRWGREIQTGENWAGAVVVDPDPDGYDGDYYLDVQYVNDLDAGSLVNQPDGELGSATFSPLRWFRLPCVEPIPNPVPMYTPPSIGDPAWAKPGVQVDTSLTIENAGNVPLQYVMVVEEENGPAGWLAVSGFSGSVPSGLDNRETGTIHLNNGGVQNDYLELIGRIIFTDAGNSPTFPDTIPINFFVVDTIILAAWDTVHTNCLSLIVSNNGNAGAQSRIKVSMDYYNAGDCDTTANTYIYDGSPVVGWIDGDDTLFFYTFWSSTYLDVSGLRPQGGEIWAGPCTGLDDASFFQSGTFTTMDSSIGMTRAWVAPSDDCPWILEYLKVFSYDGATHGGLMVGEVIDWDIPTDFLDSDTNQVNTATNTGGIDATRYMTYQAGVDETNDDTLYPFDCQLNTDRYGGNAFVDAYFNGTQQPVPYMGEVIDIDLTQSAGIGMRHGTLWEEMAYAGLRTTDSVSDLQTIMGFHNNLTIDADDEYEVVTVLATVQEGNLADLQAAVDAANAWYTAHGGITMFADDDADGRVDLCQSCCRVMGDCDGSGQADGMDVVYMVDWLWNNGPDPACMAEVNVDGIGEADPMDLVYLVDYMWNSGPDLAPCQ